MYHQCKLGKGMILSNAARRYSNCAHRDNVPVILRRRRLRSNSVGTSGMTPTTRSMSMIANRRHKELAERANTSFIMRNHPLLQRNHQQQQQQQVCTRDFSTIGASRTAFRNATPTAAAATSAFTTARDEVLLSSGSVAAAAAVLLSACAVNKVSGDENNDEYCSCSSSATVSMMPGAATTVRTSTRKATVNDNSDTGHFGAGDATASTTTACEPRIKREPRLQRKRGGPKNVMVKRMKSLQGRGLNDKYNIDFKQVLGEGAYGSVHPGRLAVTGEKIALKRISKKYTNSKDFQFEIDALLRLFENGGHPNISGLRDMYEDYGNYYLILDLVSGGEMFDHLITYGAYSEADAARLMHEISSALAFIHGVGVIHADLKPENLLLCSKQRNDGTIKMIDFGCAQVKEEGCDVYKINNKNGPDTEEQNASNHISNHDHGHNSLDSYNVGTKAYWPPERFMKGNHPDGAGDMWSVGVILYIMLTGVHPFDTMGRSTDEEIEKQIINDPKPPMDDRLVGHLSDSAIDLITKLMEQDPAKRLTAYEMLHHPWVRGETALREKMEGSDKKLSTFNIEAGVFSLLIRGGHEDMTLSEATTKRTLDTTVNPNGIISREANNLLKRAFEAFDEEGKGFVTLDDLGRIVKHQTGTSLPMIDTEEVNGSEQDDHHNDDGNNNNNNNNDGTKENLSLSDFSGLLSGLTHKHFPRGHYIFHAGHEGNAMYFLNSGIVNIETRKGQLVAKLRSGDFFGEGSLLETEKRFTSARCATPVDVIEIKRAEFEKYMRASATTKHEIKRKWRARHLSYAKNLLRLQTNLKQKVLQKGDIVYKEGDIGESMYRVDESDGGELEVSHGSKVVHKYVGGDSFGESSLLFERNRSSTVKCVSDKCLLYEMPGEEFKNFINGFPEMAASLKNMCRKRLFKKAVKGYSLTQINHSRGDFCDQDLIDAFHHADKTGTGTLNLDEMSSIMHTMDPTYPMDEIQLFLNYVDIDEDGNISLDEFKRIFRQFEHQRTPSAETPITITSQQKSKNNNYDNNNNNKDQQQEQ